MSDLSETCDECEGTLGDHNKGCLAKEDSDQALIQRMSDNVAASVARRQLLVRPIRARVTYDYDTIGWEVISMNLVRIVADSYKSRAIEEALKLFPDADILDEEIIGLQVVEKSESGQAMTLEAEIIGVMRGSKGLVLRLPNGKNITVSVEPEYREAVRDQIQSSWYR